MLVSHCLDGKKVSKEVFENVGFLITNRNGGFFNLGINSKYRGMFVPIGEEIVKILDDIRIPGETLEIRNNFSSIVRCRPSNYESFFMPFGSDSLVYELSSEDSIELFFDIKKAYDNRVWGRIYNIYSEEDKIIVEFNKVSDSREDKQDGIKEYSIFLAIDAIGLSKYEILNDWENQTYDFDRARGSHPFERYVIKGLRIKSKGIILSAAETKEQAIKSCNQVIANLEKFKNLQKEYSKISVKEIKEDRLNFALKCAIESLDSLTVTNENGTNIYAGLPWFFQFWGRDTLISIKALMIDKEYDTVKKILFKMMHHIGEDGLLPNRIPATSTKSADAIGWYFKRLDDMISMLRQERQLKNYFKKSEMLLVINKLEDSINKIFQNYTLESLAINGDQETWMDTLIDGDGRKGARIEIQALRIAMYELLFKLTERKVYKDMAEKIKIKTKESFWNGDYLADGVDDLTIRCNVFMAYYLCPDLLSREEWVRCFENMLPRVWLDWGGISSIDISDKRFIAYNTGEDPRSYHNGDSWYWINNIAAISMHRLDRERFKHYINKITEASCEDILFKGFIGCHSELSSAMKQEAWGCLSQAWSNALFIELANELQHP